MRMKRPERRNPFDLSVDPYVAAGYLLEQPTVKACRQAAEQRIKELLAEVRESAAIMSVEDRKRRLSEIARARLTDYATTEGINVDRDSPNTAAIEAVEVTTRLSRDSLAGNITVKRPVVPESLRNQIFERDNHCCVQCGAADNLQIDHVVPLSRGGYTIEGNLQTLCESCNQAKAGGKNNQREKITKLKLHNPIAAIAELNKMDRVYETGTTFNGPVQFNVVYEGNDGDTRALPEPTDTD